MRNVVSLLGVVPMALDKHTANKEGLLGAVVDALIARFDRPEPGADWPEMVRPRLISARAVTGAHQWARELIQSRRTRTPAVLGYMNDVTGDLLGGGLSTELTHHAMHALGHRIWGFSPEPFQDPTALAPPEDPAELDPMVERVRQQYPHILAIAMAATSDSPRATGGHCDEDFEFRFALDLLLDAIGRLHAAGWSAQ